MCWGIHTSGTFRLHNTCVHLTGKRAGGGTGLANLKVQQSQYPTRQPRQTRRATQPHVPWYAKQCPPYGIRLPMQRRLDQDGLGSLQGHGALLKQASRISPSTIVMSTICIANSGNGCLVHSKANGRRQDCYFLLRKLSPTSLLCLDELLILLVTFPAPCV